jgi:isoleucyl-tRNA synthetase
MFTHLHNFCAVDLSAFYFDVRKDSLYCDPAGGLKRRAARTALDLVFDCLAKWLAPVLCFTAEDAWLCRHGDAESASVHLQLYPDIPADWRDGALGEKWGKIRELRRVVTGAIELERAQKRIGSSLQAAVKVYATPGHEAGFSRVDLPEIFITSDAAFVHGGAPPGAFTLPDMPGVGVAIGLAAGEKCARCWKVLPEVGWVKSHPDLCQRCAGAVDLLAKGKT